MEVSLDIHQAANTVFCFFKYYCFMQGPVCLQFPLPSFVYILVCCLLVFCLICLDVYMNAEPERCTSLKVSHLNAQSINMSPTSNITEEFEITSTILSENFNIFLLSETWLNASIPNHLFEYPGFHPLIQLDRSDGRHAGGVALHVSS